MEANMGKSSNHKINGQFPAMSMIEMTRGKKDVPVPLLWDCANRNAKSLGLWTGAV